MELLLQAALPPVVLPPRPRRRRRRKRVRHLPPGICANANNCTEKEESDDDMGFGLFD